MITILQHGIYESAGAIEEYLTELGEPCEIVRLYETEKLQNNLPARIVILGGPMSANDDDNYPYFADELGQIRNAVRDGRPVLGICLGAQLIARAFGQRVYPLTHELGWHCIYGCAPEKYPHFSDSMTVFQWHKETFNLPDGATLLAYGDNVRNQAFRFGSAVGIQFHPEVTGSIIGHWVNDLDYREKMDILRESEHLNESTWFCRNLIDSFLRGWTA